MKNVEQLAGTILDKHIEPWWLTDMDDSIMPYAIKAMLELYHSRDEEVKKLVGVLENVVKFYKDDWMEEPNWMIQAKEALKPYQK